MNQQFMALVMAKAFQERIEAARRHAAAQAEPAGEAPPAEPQPVKRGPGRPRKAA